MYNVQVDGDRCCQVGEQVLPAYNQSAPKQLYRGDKSGLKAVGFRSFEATRETSVDLSDGDNLIRQLFNAAVDRLCKRGISVHYTPLVIEWMVKQSDWIESLNPLKTLHGYWHHDVASAIEKLILDGKLRTGDTLSVYIGETPVPGLRFDVSAPAKSKTSDGLQIG